MLSTVSSTLSVSAVFAERKQGDLAVSMAEHLASIYGTEKDKINCPFYYKIGACRHGDRCSRVHNKPLFSKTILLENLYQSPDQIIAAAAAQGLVRPEIPDEDIAHHFNDFYYDIYEEMTRYGEVENLYVCENLADHLAGNTYVKFHDQDSASAALNAVGGRYYAGRVVSAEFSPVTDFREGKCHPFERDGHCDRGDFCHFMHLRRQPQPSSASPSTKPESSELRLKYDDHDRDRYRQREYGSDDRHRPYQSYNYSSSGRDRYRESRHGQNSWYDAGSRRDRDRHRGRERRDDGDDDHRRDRYRDRSRGRRDYDRPYRSSRD